MDVYFRRWCDMEGSVSLDVAFGFVDSSLEIQMRVVLFFPFSRVFPWEDF